MALVVLITVVATGAHRFLPSLRFGAVNNLPALLEQSVRFGFWVFVAMLIALISPSWKFLPRRLALSTLFTAYCFMLFLFVYVLPKNEPLRGEKAFARIVRAKLDGQLDKLVLYKTRGATYIYLGAEKPIPEFFDSDDLASHIDNNTDAWIVADANDPPSLPFPISTTARSADYRWEKSGFVGEYVLLHVDQGGLKTSKVGP